MRGREQRFSTTTRSASARAAVELGSARRLVGPDGQPGEQLVDRAAPGHGDGGEAQLAEGPLPLGRLDGDAVGAAEAEGEEGGGGDGVTVARGTEVAVPARPDGALSPG